MLTIEKTTLTAIGKEPFFKSTIKKLSIGSTLSCKEKSYILSCAILFLKSYEKDTRFTSYADFSYYIILKYSLKYNDLEPLYDFSINFGFYPVAKAILKKDDTRKNIIDDFFSDLKLDGFSNKGNYIETLEQYTESKKLLKNDSFQSSYIAPTSFGKSSLIVDYINERVGVNSKIAIIVPTKSLLMQTYKMIRGADLNKKIIIHDEMYSESDSNFIAVFTQERALRLLNRKKIYFDVLVIDEAHNMLKLNSRSVLLSRLITKNNRLNPQQKVIYLSPLIENIENLRVSNDQSISSHKVSFNIKETEIYEYRLDSSVYKYNRFVNEFYELGTSPNLYAYIIDNSSEKNFLYNYRPIKIEALAKNMCINLAPIELTTELIKIEEVLKKEVHKDFYAIKYLKYGLVYLHGKIPDLIKEYLEFKYKSLSEIKYVIANSVILEGMNLPIDSLFILNAYSLKGKELMNLIGRVNRLNEVFSNDSSNLEKLLPKVHFINNEEYYRKNSNMSNKVKLLRSRIFEDKVENPILESFDFDAVTGDIDSKKEKVELIQEHESFLQNQTLSEFDSMKSYLIELGLNAFYSDADKLTASILDQMVLIKSKNISEWDEFVMMDKINFLFIKDISRLLFDKEVERLENKKARNYYENHILIGQKRSLNQNINSQLRYFKELSQSNESKLYFGSSYGEEPYESVSFPESHNKVYIDLSLKSDVELANLAVVKLKMEDDFISFKLNKFIVMMHDYELISEEDYNRYVYGTTNIKKIELTKSGLSISLISRLDDDNQMPNLRIDEIGNLIANDEFDDFLNTIDDFYRFEITRHLS